MQKKLLFFLIIIASIASNYGMEKKNKNKGKIKQKFGNVINKVKSSFPTNKNNNDLQNDRCFGVLPLELYDLIKIFIIPTTFKDGLSIIETLITVSSFELTCKPFESLVDSSDIDSMIKERISSVLDIDIFLKAISTVKKRSRLGKRSKFLIPQGLHGYLNNLFKNVQKMDKLNNGLCTLQQQTQRAFVLFDCGLRPDFIIYKYWNGSKASRFLFSYIYAPNNNRRVLEILKKHPNISKKCINAISPTAFFDLKEYQLTLEKELLIQFVLQELNPNYQFRIGYEEQAPLLAIAMEFFPEDLSLIILLLEKGADPNFRFLESYELGYATPFLKAQGNHPEILRLF